MVGLYPEAEIVISYQVPTYKVGRSRVSLGLWKDGVSLYTTDPSHIRAFRARHPTVKANKASLNFNRADQLPEADIRKVIRRAIGPA
jgi:uncharacterized protein YdhG (YjbR/CyaY superfamily)